MVKRKTTKSDDISNWAVVLMLVAVIVVSTLSIVLFMDASEEAIDMESSAQGTVSLEVVNPDAEATPADVSVIMEDAESAGSVELEISE